MDLDANAEVTIAVLNEIRHMFMHTMTHFMWIEMGKLERLSPAAGLILHAELDRFLRFRNRIPARVQPNRRQVAGNLPKAGSEAYETLDAMGFFERLDVRMAPGSPNLKHPSTSDAARSWFRLRSGARYNPDVCRQLIGHYRKYFHIPVGWANDFLVAINETVGNVSTHAYIDADSRHPFVLGRWWLLGKTVRGSNEVRFVLWDQGHSIPATMAQAWRGRPLRLGGHLDVRYLEEAAKRGRSRYDSLRHGRGLSSLMRLVEDHGGCVEVLSGGGRLLYDQAHGRVASQLPHPMQGTLIEWRQQYPPRATA